MARARRISGSASASRFASVARRAPASAHSTRFQTSRGSKFDCIAGSRMTRPPTAKSASPGSTVA